MKSINNYTIRLDTILGKGSYSTVYLGFNNKNPTELVAIKEIYLKNIEFRFIE